MVSRLVIPRQKASAHGKSHVQQGQVIMHSGCLAQRQRLRLKGLRDYNTGISIITCRGDSWSCN